MRTPSLALIMKYGTAYDGLRRSAKSWVSKRSPGGSTGALRILWAADGDVGEGLLSEGIDHVEQDRLQRVYPAVVHIMLAFVFYAVFLQSSSRARLAGPTTGAFCAMP